MAHVLNATSIQVSHAWSRRRILLLMAGAVVAGALAYRWTPAPRSFKSILREIVQLRDAGEWRKVLELARSVDERSPDKATALAEETRANWELSRGRDLEAAAKAGLARERNRQFPSHATLAIWAVLADHFVGQERFEEARGVLWELHRAHLRLGQPTHIYLMMFLRLRYETVANSLAIERVALFLKNDPDEADNLRAQAIYAARAGDLATARAAALRAFERTPSEPRFAETLLDLLLKDGDADEAARIVERLPNAVGERPEIVVLKARVAERRGDWAAARALFFHALSREPRRLDAIHGLCQVLRRQGDHAELTNWLAMSARLSEANRIASGVYQHYRIGRRRPSPDDQAELVAALRELDWSEEADAWEQLP